MTHLSDTNVRRQLWADRETCKHRSGGYLEPSLFMPHLTRTSAVLTCAEQCSRSSRLVLRTATKRGFVPGARRRHCPGNASTMQEKCTQNTRGAYSEDTQIRTPDTADICTAARSLSLNPPAGFGMV